jgi:hypothetical protein
MAFCRFARLPTLLTWLFFISGSCFDNRKDIIQNTTAQLQTIKKQSLPEVPPVMEELLG